VQLLYRHIWQINFFGAQQGGVMIYGVGVVWVGGGRWVGFEWGGGGWGGASSLSRVRGIRVGDSFGVGWSDRVCCGSGGVWGGGGGRVHQSPPKVDCLLSSRS
jgi:hypothetical protein